MPEKMTIDKEWNGESKIHVTKKKNDGNKTRKKRSEKERKRNEKEEIFCKKNLKCGLIMIIIYLWFVGLA